jgi:hypothetical protein
MDSSLGLSMAGRQEGGREIMRDNEGDNKR